MLSGDDLPTGAVTFLFTDIEGSTQLWEKDPEAMRSALRIHDGIVESSVGDHDGVVFKTGGDSFCASFSNPLQALNASLAAQRGLQTTDWETDGPIMARMGLHTGTAQIRGNDYFGPTLNRAARLMSAGHGGQVLLSASTQQLVVDELPTGVTLVGLGTHYLKDLDRPETIYQVEADGLAGEFAPLEIVKKRGENAGQAAAQAYKDKEWHKVVDRLAGIEAESELTAEQHEMMGFALWWLGDHDVVIRRFEQTYNAYIAEENPQGAAVAAVELAEFHTHNLASQIAAGWVRRAERLLEGDKASTAAGYLLRWKAVQAFEGENDLDKALELSRDVAEIGRANADGNLEVLALQDQGRFLVASGNLDEGMPLMDEAMISAVAGDVNPNVVGRSYCNMLAVCDQTGDVRRAAEWSEAAERWCSEGESSAYPGVCRIFKAEVMWQNGDWVGAESEVMRASTELGLYTDISGEAWYQFGVMRLRAGDDQGAENAFQEALTRGREPIPGYAYVLAHQDQLESAIDLLVRSLSSPSLSKLDRARFLPALIELGLESGDTEAPTAATNELEEISRLARSDFFRAQASHGRGIVALATGDPEAIAHLKEAVTTFSRLGLPYESARSRAELAKAYVADGADALATMELKAAKTALERLGSESDAKAVDEILTSSD
ncbi:MAG: adenylate/guanylate cyclase domain-containing protein [Actinomycetota bacterium]|nr:adenylate/guanylate cyclase domain-containing protein [Actinomycetota bacterium]